MNKLEKAKLNAQHQIDYQVCKAADSFPKLFKTAVVIFVAGFMVYIGVTA